MNKKTGMNAIKGLGVVAAVGAATYLMSSNNSYAKQKKLKKMQQKQ